MTETRPCIRCGRLVAPHPDDFAEEMVLCFDCAGHFFGREIGMDGDLLLGLFKTLGARYAPEEQRSKLREEGVRHMATFVGLGRSARHDWEAAVSRQLEEDQEELRDLARAWSDTDADGLGEQRRRADEVVTENARRLEWQDRAMEALTCMHCLPEFDEEAAREMTASEVREKFPRFAGPCRYCGFRGIRYASVAHQVAGDW